MIYSN